MEVELWPPLGTTVHQQSSNGADDGRERIDCGLSHEAAALRAEIRACESAMQREMQRVDAGLRAEVQDLRSELLKWGVLYWIGQAAATAAIISAFIA
jgi:hypothetical protein